MLNGEHVDILGMPGGGVNSYLNGMLFLLEGNFAAKYSMNALYVNNITRGLTHNVTQKRDVLEVERCKAVGARDFSPENMNASNVPRVVEPCSIRARYI